MKSSSFKFYIDKDFDDNYNKQLKKNYSQRQMIIQEKIGIGDENDDFPRHKINNYYQSNHQSNNNKMIQRTIPKPQNKNYYTISERESKNYLFNNKMKISTSKNKKPFPKDSISKKYSSLTSKNNISLNGKCLNTKGKIPRMISFRKYSFSGKENINSNISISKVDYSEFREIPKSEYDSFRGKEILFVGGGMETGEYKFNKGQILIKADLNQSKKITIDEEEIYKEIMKRKIKSKRQKKIRYEILDKFCVRTEFDGKPIKQIQKQIQYEQGKSNEFYISKKNKTINKSFDSKFENAQIKESKGEWKKIMNYNCKKIHKEGNFRYIDILSLPYDNYSIYLFSLINKIRNNPSSYIQIIEKEKSNIIVDKYGRIIYNGSIKVGLNQGVYTFDNAINYLRNIEPMEKLQFSQLMTIPSPKNENDIRNIEYMTYQVENIINNGISIKSYWREIFINLFF